MLLTEVEVRRFRNILRARLAPAAGVNVLWGDNAQGKTNILEAVFYLVTGRSFRTRLDRECLPWAELRQRWLQEASEAPPSDGVTDPDVAVARGRLRRQSGDHELTVVIEPSRKRVLADGKPIDKLGMLWGRLNAVLFTPADLSIVQQGPSLRRQFLDTTLSQISPAYLRRLQDYSHALRQRNALLRSHRPASDLAAHFDIWEAGLVENGLALCQERMAYLERLVRLAGAHYARIAEQAGETLACRYAGPIGRLDQMDADEAAGRFRERLAQSRLDDAARGATACGPHRDDCVFSIDGRDLRDYGSQGQQRSVILALRLAEVDVMEQRSGEAPILLLDDIVGELDPRRTTAFLGLLGERNVQTILTTTCVAEVERHIRVERQWRMENGHVDAGAPTVYPSCEATGA